jgi:tryptophan synthase alpha chain
MAATRISRMLTGLERERRKGLVPYLTVGDPDMEITRAAVLAIAEAGADAVELGIPFSDPMADGPVIQGSSARALAAGSSVPRVLELVAKLREDTDVPLILFGYYNPFFRYGHERLARDIKAAGADGLLCVDLPPEEARDLVKACRKENVDRIFLLAPTSDESRIHAVAKVASGFVYFVSVTGVTGARSAAPQGIENLVSRVRGGVGLPVGVGFGISTPEQAATVAGYADLVVVGSALVRRMHEAGAAAAASVAREFVAELRRGVDRAR